MMQTEQADFPRVPRLGGLFQGVRRPCWPRPLTGEEQGLRKVVRSRLMPRECCWITVFRERFKVERKRNWFKL